MTFVFTFLLAAFALIVVLMSLARGAPLLVLSRIEILKVGITRRPHFRQHSKCAGLWASCLDSILINSLSGRRVPPLGFSVAAGGLAA
jgi:hypothetical protein